MQVTNLHGSSDGNWQFHRNSAISDIRKESYFREKIKEAITDYMTREVVSFPMDMFSPEKEFNSM